MNMVHMHYAHGAHVTWAWRICTMSLAHVQHVRGAISLYCVRGAAVILSPNGIPKVRVFAIFVRGLMVCGYFRRVSSVGNMFGADLPSYDH